MVSGAEHGQEVAGGFLLGDVLNIDHHAPSPRMDRPVSSATLAIAHLRAAGLPHGTIVLNHTDCDSILSAGIASGRLAPEDRFSEAAIAADHTGADNEIADLLQALDGRRDLRLSFRSLDRLLRGESLEKTAEDGLAERRRKRRAAADVVRRGGLAAFPCPTVRSAYAGRWKGRSTGDPRQRQPAAVRDGLPAVTWPPPMMALLSALEGHRCLPRRTPQVAVRRDAPPILTARVARTLLCSGTTSGATRCPARGSGNLGRTTQGACPSTGAMWPHGSAATKCPAQQPCALRCHLRARYGPQETMMPTTRKPATTDIRSLCSLTERAVLARYLDIRNGARAGARRSSRAHTRRFTRRP
jgi:hypothetical protein